MTYRELDTKLYLDYAAADADKDCEHKVWLAAAKPYWDAYDTAKAEWNAIPECDAKDSACGKADDMCYAEELFSHENGLAWYVAAISAYQFNCDMA